MVLCAPGMFLARAAIPWASTDVCAGMKPTTTRVASWALVLVPALLAVPGCDDVEGEEAIPRYADDEALMFDAEDEADLEEEDEEEAADPEMPADDDLGLAAPSPNQFGASDMARLNHCEWKKESTSSARFLYVECEPYQNPISGGCNNSSTGATIQSSMPFENGAQNWPEDGEAWFNLSIDSGWRCKKDGDAGTLTGVALCCGINPPG